MIAFEDVAKLVYQKGVWETYADGVRSQDIDISCDEGFQLERYWRQYENLIAKVQRMETTIEKYLLG